MRTLWEVDITDSKSILSKMRAVNCEDINNKDLHIEQNSL